MANLTKSRKKPDLQVGGFPTADLTPPKRKQAIENAELQTKLVKLLGGVTVLALLISGAAVGFKLYNSAQYNAAQAESTSINTKIEAQSVIDNMVTVYDSRKGAIASASAASINWEKAYTSIQQVTASAGATITSLQMQSGGTANDSASTAALINIQSQSPIYYADVYSAYSKLKGLAPGQLSISSLGSTKDKDQRTYTYSIAVLLDSSFLKTQGAAASNPTEAASSPTTDTPKASPFTELNDGDVTVKDLQGLRQDVADQNTQQTGAN